MIPSESHIRQDDICPICLTILYKPTRLKSCGHIFCGPCIDEATNMYEHKSCPLCRKKFGQADKIYLQQRGKEIQRLYPQQIKSKMASIKDQVFYRVEVGNTTKVIQSQQSNKYRWTLFVKPAEAQAQLSKFVEKVEVKLHPTFNPSTITFLGTQKIQLPRLGWGTFRINIKIYWKKPYGGFVQIFHDLEFEPIVKKTVVCKVGGPIQ